MLRSKIAIIAAALLVTASVAHAAPTIVNLSADPSNPPNAGNNSPGYTYNPIIKTLAAGTYSVGVVGIAGGGAYDAYSVYAPTNSNAAFTDGNWSVSVNGAVQTQLSTQRFNTATAAEAYYGGLAPLQFTLTATTNVAFYVDDTAQPYFADDAGGVSLAINSVPASVPEPVSLALLGGAITSLAIARRRRA